mgnify:CR=1 FL=1
MDNHAVPQETKPKAIWYYSVKGKAKGPLTTSNLQQLYKVGIITGRTLIWAKGFSSWKPLSQYIRNASSVPATKNKSLKGPISVVAILLVLIIVGGFCYIQFFIKTPLEGGWQSKNFLGVTDGIMLFDQGKCWLYNSDDKPYSVDYHAVKDGQNSYKVTLSKDNSTNVMVMLISFVDNDTINVAMPGSTGVYKMTRMDATMAKNMMETK